ncbi:glycosyl transferase family 1, partial [Escherichia coli]|nr:glycosyl transferase family 1 [Escherichia coli]
INRTAQIIVSLASQAKGKCNR